MAVAAQYKRLHPHCSSRRICTESISNEFASAVYPNQNRFQILNDPKQIQIQILKEEALGRRETERQERRKNPSERSERKPDSERNRNPQQRPSFRARSRNSTHLSWSVNTITFGFRILFISLRISFISRTSIYRRFQIQIQILNRVLLRNPSRALRWQAIR